jgi:hypothetical protein
MSFKKGEILLNIKHYSKRIIAANGRLISLSIRKTPTNINFLYTIHNNEIILNKGVRTL